VPALKVSPRTERGKGRRLDLHLHSPDVRNLLCQHSQPTEDLGRTAEAVERHNLYLGRPPDEEWLGGIKGEAFMQRFSLADFVKVKSADYAHGVLSINLVREIPEEAKPRQIAIGASSRPEAIEHRAA
jgi:hypothetical protein